MSRSAVKVVISGLVQGVGFRYFVYREAVKLGIDGYARNLPDGQVEVVASGDKGAVDELIKLVRVGPRYASVSDMHLVEIPPPENLKGFAIY